MTRIRVTAKTENLDKLLYAITKFAEKNDFTSDVVRKIRLSAEEVLVNIINYAYPESEGEVEIYCHRENDTRLTVEILDNGIPLDPLALPEPDLTSKLSDRKVGGLGVYIIRNVAEDVKYRREGNANILTLIFSK